jgi:hypothetical protein
MITVYFTSALANHLWQSTVFACIAGLLTLTLRNNHARTRHWLWLVASVKFLIPFSLLAAAGSRLGWLAGWSAGSRAARPRTVCRSRTDQSTVSPLLTPAAVAPAGLSRHDASLLPAFLLAVWACGFWL